MAIFITRIVASHRAALRDENGAVSADWVPLTAAIIGVAFGVMTQISDATISLSSKIRTGIASKPLGAETSGENSSDDWSEDSGDDSSEDSGDDSSDDSSDDSGEDSGDDSSEDSGDDSGDDSGEDSGED